MKINFDGFLGDREAQIWESGTRSKNNIRCFKAHTDNLPIRTENCGFCFSE